MNVKAVFLALLFVSQISNAQKNFVVDVKNPKAEIQPTMYGIFFEDINFAADGGIYAELVKNRSFEFLYPLMGWKEPNSNRHSLNLKSGRAIPITKSGNVSNKHYIRIDVNDASGYSIINEGFRGIGIKESAKYDLSFMANVASNIKHVKFEIIDEKNNPIASNSVAVIGNNWETYKTTLTASKTCAKAKLKITFDTSGTINMDMISMFPEDTWMGRKKGLRKDLVQLLADLHPGFLRFPGGCIVEGRVLERRYQWKKTVGSIENRQGLVNRWNTEFSHRSTPDYFQSFGLGFFEYFQLSEDIGAEPLPILNCGMACQYNTGELVPINEIAPYVQDALDLIEFANGNVSSKWGKVRAEMGHPKPFNLKYIGIGNEQWGKDYFDRYVIFEKAIKEKYPEIKIVSGSGPSPDGEYFDYGWKQLKKLKADLVDEHYYRSPEWFKENATRYDNYDRNAPKVFAGEYAAHNKAKSAAMTKNTLECALAEAAFMTGMERNADVVYMTSYAPLLAHVDAWQWAPDLIWFDNLNAVPTANYYVQKMFANNAGTNVLSTTCNKQNITGQDGLYASTVMDKATSEIIIKIVNTENKAQRINVDLKGAKKVNEDVNITVLHADDLNAVNTLKIPTTVVPQQLSVKAKKKGFCVEIQGNSFYVCRVKVN